MTNSLLGAPLWRIDVLAGLAWRALGAGEPDAAGTFAADAVRAARVTGDPETQPLADAALAAATAVAGPTSGNADNFLALVRERTRGPAHRSLTDEPDLVALAARLTSAVSGQGARPSR